MAWEEVSQDPSLGGKRTALITEAAGKLAATRMIAFDSALGNFVITDLGRIAAKYYIRHKSIEIFNQTLKEKMSEADVIAMLCMSTEVRIINFITVFVFVVGCAYNIDHLVRPNSSSRERDQGTRTVDGSSTLRGQSGCQIFMIIRLLKEIRRAALTLVRAR